MEAPEPTPEAKDRERARVEELLQLAELPDTEPQKLENFLRVRTLLAQIRPELGDVFRGLFEGGRQEKDARTFLGRIREILSPKRPTREEFELLEAASRVPGFALIQRFIADTMYPEEKPPVTQRVIREMPEEKRETPLGGKPPIYEPNIGGLWASGQISGLKI